MTKGNVISLLFLLIMMVVIPLGVLFVQNQQRQTQLNSQAAGVGQITVIPQPSVVVCNGSSCTTTTTNIGISIQAPSF